MKETGIVRRIDDLGRVVIPREVRRTLKIREGDPLEIFIQNDGVFLKKYSLIGDLKDFAREYSESLFEATGHIALIGDTDCVIAVAGGRAKNFLIKNLWNLAQKAVEERKLLSASDLPEEFSYKSQIVAPIILEGDVIGVVGLISNTTEVGPMEKALVETACSFLAKQMEV